MAQIDRLLLLELAGEPPAELGLAPLRTLERSASLVEAALARFLSPGAQIERVRDWKELSFSLAPVPGLTVLYAVGHAWERDGHFTTALLEEGRTRHLRGDELLAELGRLIPAGSRGLFLVDTCHAAALARELPGPVGERSSFVFASAVSDAAFELPLDGATRFALALAATLRRTRSGEEIDVVALALAVGQEIQATRLVEPQTVEYWTSGGPLQLSGAGQESTDTRRGPRTYTVLQTLLVATGVLLAAATGALSLYYRDHFRLVVRAGDLAQAATDLVITAEEEDPARNRSRLLATWRL